MELALTLSLLWLDLNCIALTFITSRSFCKPVLNLLMPVKTWKATFAKTPVMNLRFDFSKPIAIGADHAGYEYKTVIVDLLQNKGLQVKDFGTYSKDSVDYPDFAHPVADAVKTGEVDCGILICGSANGVAITANKHDGVRAAICWLSDIARLSRQHNNANILCIPARFVSLPASEEMVNVFLDTNFEGGRHEKRVEKMSCL
jgi:ribose 5-phosphate isomerase B